MTEAKLIHILGGSDSQLSLVMKAKEMGLKVLVSDINEEPPCKKIADIFEQADIKDLEKNLEIARKHRIDAVITDQTDISVPTVAYISDKLGLNSLSFETAKKFTNKNHMKTELLKSKTFDFSKHIPQFHFADTQETAKESIKELSKSGIDSIVLKPCDSQGSRGVVFLKASDTNIEEKLSIAFEGGFGAGINIEEFITGEEYAVDTLVENGKCYPLAIASKKQYPENPCLDQAFEYPAKISSKEEKELFELQKKIINEFGLKKGVCHGEYKINRDNGKAVLMEIAARGAGSSINSVINSFLSGLDINKVLINQALAIPNDICVEDYKEKFALIEWLNPKPGLIKQVILETSIKNIADKLHIKQFENIKITNNADSRDRLGYYILSSTKSRDELNEKKKILLEGIKLEYA